MNFLTLLAICLNFKYRCHERENPSVLKRTVPSIFVKIALLKVSSKVQLKRFYARQSNIINEYS